LNNLTLGVIFILMSSEQISDEPIQEESLTVEQIETDINTRAEGIRVKIKALERSQYSTSETASLQFSPVPPVVKK
jgi:hypothetical protein